MTRPRGGYIGFTRTPTATAASGIWTLREVEAARRAGIWPGPFLPTQLTGLQLWLDAADPLVLFDATTGGSLVAADGGVARWEDKSGNARHATQSTDANRPTRKTAIQGWKDVLRFDGSNDRMSIASSTATFKFLHGEDATVFLVGKGGTTANPDAFYAFLATHNGSAFTVGYSIYFEDRNLPGDSFFANNQARVIIGASGGPVVDSEDRGVGSFSANTFKVISAITRPTQGTAANRLAARVNGGSSVSGNNGTAARSTANASGDLTIGSTPAGAVFLLGDIAEIIIYDSALSDANREAVENYLIAKWGIT